MRIGLNIVSPYGDAVEFVKIYRTSVPNAARTLDRKVNPQSLLSRAKGEPIREHLSQLAKHGELNFWDFGVKATPLIPLGSSVKIICGLTCYVGTVIRKISDDSGELGDLLGWARQFKESWRNICAIQIQVKQQVSHEEIDRLRTSSEEIAPNLFAAVSLSRKAEALTEGSVFELTLSIFERDPVARRRCLEHYGNSCQVCDFNFGVAYGDLGDGFIHVHHIVPLAQIRELHEVDPIKDLVPICPNCHAMIHISKGAPLTVEQLRAMVNGRRD